MRARFRKALVQMELGFEIKRLAKLKDDALVEEYKRWQASNRAHAERSLEIHGLPKDTFDQLDPEGVKKFFSPPDA